MATTHSGLGFILFAVSEFSIQGIQADGGELCDKKGGCSYWLKTFWNNGKTCMNG